MYRTAQYMKQNRAKNVFEALDVVLRIYNSAGFRIAEIHCDREFEPIFTDLKDEWDVTMVYPPAQSHVPQAEQNNRTLKDRVRSTFHRLPYKALPRIIAIHMVQEEARKSNWFPNKHGVSKYFSPRMIVHQQALDYAKECQHALGAYVQAHDEPKPSDLNTNVQRAIDAIYLRPVTNGHEVYNLATQSVITRRRVTELPVTPNVIRTVEAIADAQKQKGLRIKTRQGLVLYDSSWIAGVDYAENDNEEDDDEDYTEEEQEGDDDDEDELQESVYTTEDETEDFLLFVSYFPTRVL